MRAAGGSRGRPLRTGLIVRANVWRPAGGGANSSSRFWRAGAHNRFACMNLGGRARPPARSLDLLGWLVAAAAAAGADNLAL
jgi:hypothetical protein